MWKLTRIVKLVLISAVILFLLITALSLLLPSHVRISRALDIPTPKEKILPLLSDLKQWHKWNRFVIMGDSMLASSNTSSDTTLSAGQVFIHLRRIDGDTVVTTWSQNNIESTSHIVCLAGQGYTTVQWYFDFHLKWYPWEKFQSIIYDKQLGPEMETSLENLRRISEQY